MHFLYPHISFFGNYFSSAAALNPLRNKKLQRSGYKEQILQEIVHKLLHTTLTNSPATIQLDIWEFLRCETFL